MFLTDWKGLLVVAGAVLGLYVYNRKSIADSVTAVLDTTGAVGGSIGNTTYDLFNAPDGGKIWIGDIIGNTYYGWVDKNWKPPEESNPDNYDIVGGA